MKNIKNSIRNYYQNEYNHHSNYDLIKEQLSSELQERNINMKFRNRLISLCATFVILVLCISCAFAFSKKPSPTNKVSANSIVTMSVNPKITFVTGEDGLVTSVYGENDEGKLIIEGLDILGITLNEAIDLVIEAETKTGYLIKGSVQSSDNNITFEITTTKTEDLIKLENEIKNHVESKLQSLDLYVSEKVKFVKDTTDEFIKNKYLQIFKDGEVEGKTNEQLIKEINDYYLSVIKFPTTELEQLFNYYKEYEYDLRKHEFVNNLINNTPTINSAIKASYNSLYTNLTNSITSFQNAYFDNFLSEESNYQITLKKLQETKKEILTLKNSLANETDELKKLSLGLTLEVKETLYNTMIAEFELFKNSCALALEFYTESINKVLTSLNSMLVSDEQLQEILNNNIDEMNTTLNNVHDQLVSKFTTVYKEDIQRFLTDIKNYKDSLNNNN